MSEDKPLVSPQSARFLAQVANRLANSFELSELSAEEAIEVYMLLDRLMEALWREHARTLVPFYEAMLQRLGLPDDDDEPDDDEPDGSGSLH